MIRILGRLPIKDFFVSVSGGVDSMTLLHFLLAGRRKFTVLYYNHGTDHGREAQSFVEEQCDKLGVPLEIGHLWPSMLNCSKSQEENWRDCRYGWLSKFSDKGTILMAHHLNDAVETYVMTALKGRPTTIPYRNEKYNIIRPFLITARKDIVNWAENHGVKWIEDPSNRDSVHDRNFVRNEMMPMIRRLNPGIESVVRKMVLKNYESQE